MATFVNRYAGATYEDDPNPISVGIISFYKDQVKSLQQQWKKIPSLNSSQMNVKIATVDGT
jgi:superfamily I DNA and/or RNA helicase